MTPEFRKATEEFLAKHGNEIPEKFNREAYFAEFKRILMEEGLDENTAEEKTRNFASRCFTLDREFLESLLKE